MSDQYIDESIDTALAITNLLDFLAGFAKRETQLTGASC